MKRTLKELGYMEDEYTYCAECGTDIRWWLKKKGHIAYHLHNGDIVCSKNCMKEYAIGYFSTDDIITRG
jgi:hypothetical protein